MKYTLQGKTPVACDMATWMAMFDSDERIVAYDTLPGDVSVSTVFLGIDHAFGGGPPLLFETMIFGGPLGEYQERYSTWNEAEEGHARAVALAGGDLVGMPESP